MITPRTALAGVALASLASVSLPVAAHPGEHPFAAVLDTVEHWLTSPYHLLAAAVAIAGAWLLAAAARRRLRSRARSRTAR